ncbi:MAG: family 78 glycoside hydrolase catalytic domain [Eubacteriales bacterium]
MLKPINFRADSGKLRKDFRYRTVASPAPVLSWAVDSTTPDSVQSAYNVKVWCGESVLWQSGWVDSAEQCANYAGSPLPSGKRIDFSVAVRDNHGGESEASQDWFIYGGLESWDAGWIGASEDIKRKAVYFRYDFTAPSDVRDACLYLCGLGYHKAYLNGQELDISVMDPAHSDYTKSCYYTVIPVDKALFREGLNTLGVIVSEGWRRNDTSFINGAIGDRKIKFYGTPQLSAIFNMHNTNGTTYRITSGSDWKWSHGAIFDSNIYDGETYDASASVEGWNLPDVSPSCFKGVVELPAPGGVMRPMTLEPIREGALYTPVEIFSPADGAYIVDFGQNLAGVVRLTLPKMKAGQKVTVVHAEVLDEDGTLYTAPMRQAKVTDTYIADGINDLKIWQPAFTYHGFRYVSVEGLPLLDRDEIKAVSLHTDLDNNSFFSCGSALVNKIHKNVVMTERANMHSILTDCPQRDERMQWMNDATVRFEETPYNFEIGRMFPKIVQDVIDGQNEDGAFSCCAPFVFGGTPADPVCSSFLVAGYQALLHMGNMSVIKYAYDRFAAWEELLLSKSEDYIVNYSYYGDWAGPAYACVGEDGAFSSVTPGILMSTGYSYFNSSLLSSLAEKLGRDEKAAHYSSIAVKIKKAFLDKWYNPETGVVAEGSQASQAFALWLDILPEEGRVKAAQVMRDNLVSGNYMITTGNLCSRYLMDMLTKYGYIEDAWKVITREEYPSFGFMIQNEATTVWERFELKKNPGMNSHSHPMYGAVGYWFYAWLCGVRPVGKSFDSFVVDPHYPAELLSAHAVVDSVKGEISVKWIKRYGKLHLYVNVPFGSVAQVKVNGADTEVSSGYHHFEWEL